MAQVGQLVAQRVHQAGFLEQAAGLGVAQPDADHAVLVADSVVGGDAIALRVQAWCSAARNGGTDRRPSSRRRPHRSPVLDLRRSRSAERRRRPAGQRPQARQPRRAQHQLARLEQPRARCGPLTSCERVPSSPQQASRLAGVVGQDDVRAGALDRGQHLQNRALAVDPALLGRGHEHGVLAADVVGRQRDAEGLLARGGSRPGRPAPA